MNTPRIAHQKRIDPKRLFLLASFSLLMAGVVILFGFIAQANLSSSKGQEYFLGLCFLFGIIMWSPSIYLVSKGDFDPFHPLVYPVWFILFPTFAFGGLMFWSLDLFNSSWIVSLIPDPGYHLWLSMIYAILGYIGLVVGFVLPWGERMGRTISMSLPAWQWDPNRLVAPAMVLILIGTAAYIFAYTVGAVGYQMDETPSLFGGLAFSLSTIGDMGAIFLWWSFFRWRLERRLQIPAHRRISYLIWFLAFLMWGGRVIFIGLLSGSKGFFLMAMLQVVGAYYLSGRKFRLKTVMIWGSILAIAVTTGLAWGTTYREIKGTENLVSVAEGIQIASDTITQVARRGFFENMGYAVAGLLGRFESISSFAVIVSNYRSLREIEEQVGIANNIWTYTWTAFIPRFLWPEKPVVSDARTIGAIYFDFPDNSFAFTIFGDLLRNFGPLGIPIGMALLGFLFRILYTIGVKEGTNSAWRNASYFMLLTVVNYEAFYGAILPGWIRLGLMLVIVGFVVNFMIRFAPGRFFSALEKQI